MGAILILYTPRDERHWKCLLICIPSGIHSRHFCLLLLLPRPLLFLHIVDQSQISSAFLALFLVISLQDFLYILVAMIYGFWVSLTSQSVKVD